MPSARAVITPVYNAPRGAVIGTAKRRCFYLVPQYPGGPWEAFPAKKLKTLEPVSAALGRLRDEHGATVFYAEAEAYEVKVTDRARVALGTDLGGLLAQLGIQE